MSKALGAEVNGTAKFNAKVQPVWTKEPLEPGVPGKHYNPSITLNGSTLSYKVVSGIKVFHLTCEEVDHIFIPKTPSNQECRAFCWGFNKQVHGPTIECVEGDRIRIYVTNRLPASTSIHWHGILLPNGMDGVGGLNQKAIQPGETFKYEFTVWQHGTYMYHSHHDEMTQMQLGMLGMLIIHPRSPQTPPPDRDYVYMLSEWKIIPGTRRPDPNEMTEFNMLTLNAKAFPGTAPMLAKMGDRVRIRIGNLSSMEHHPMHIHGHAFKIIETDGGPIPESAQWPETTVLVPTGSTRTVEFIADNPGDWAFHCHMLHHVMNQMGHGLPNIIGIKPGALDKKVRAFLPGYMTMGQEGMADMGEMGMKIPANSVPMVGAPGPYDYITMGGLYTNLKVREDLGTYKPEAAADYSYAGWYQYPPALLASPASADELKRDLGFVPEAKPAGTAPMPMNHNH
ncbi:MAG: multicopper oxidase family protein [Candidatus Methylacidiphilales bacterium]|nr:copper oxidase [Candidatus Methylacidiphilales bacterium]